MMSSRDMQQAIDSSIDRLVLENPIHQLFLQGQQNKLDSSISSFSSPFSHVLRPMSASAIPQLHSFAQAQRYDPFLSPQCLNSTFPSAVSRQTAADIFNSLKNPANFDGDQSSFESSCDNNTSYKDNSSFVANLSNNGSYLCSKQQPMLDSTRQYKPLQPRSMLQVANNGNNFRDPNAGLQQPFRTGHLTQTNHESRDKDTAVGNLQGNLHSEDDELQTLSLFLWIIKPCPGTQSICVEGKRSILDDNFWHSGVIIRRVTERIVETTTGSLYKLEGNMELLDAMSEGFSRETAEAFWLGFPEDWELLIQDHFRSQHLNRIEKELSDSDTEITTIDDIDETDGLDTGDVTLTVSADEGVAVETTVETAALEENKKVNEKREEVLKSPIDNQPKNGKKEKHGKGTVVLKNWIIKQLPNGKGINIIGTKPNGLLWHSSAIEKRLEKRLLLSSGGSLYKLKGPIDKLLALNEGLTMEMINAFSSGFPKEWQELIQEHFCIKTRKKKVKESKKKQKPESKLKPVKEKVVKDSKAAGDIGDAKRSKQLKKARKADRRKLVTESESDSDCIAKSSYSKRKEISLNMKTSRPDVKNNLMITEPYERKKFVLTPNGEMVDLETLGRSRSGRLIKPPLHWWTGQTLEMEGDNVKVKAPTLAASRFLQNFEDGYKRCTRKIKPYWNPRQKDKDYSFIISKASPSDGCPSSVKSSKSTAKVRAESKLADSDHRTCQSKTEIIMHENVDESLKLEVEEILEKSKKSRKVVQKSSTCYSSGKKSESETDGDPFNICEDTDKDDERNRQSAGKSSSQGRSERQKVRTSMGTNRESHKKRSEDKRKQKREKVEQENVVSSSTSEIHDPLNGTTVAGMSNRTRSGSSRERAANADSIRSPNNTVDDDLECKTRNAVNGRPTRSCTVSHRLPIIIETDDNSSDEKKSKKKGNRKVTTHKKSSKKQETQGKENHENESITNDSHWTEEEKERLREACRATSLNHPHYLEKITEAVRTKSLEACRTQIFGEQTEVKSSAKKKKKNTKGKAKATCLTANKGTLKRKQQLRDLLDQQDENYSDDPFDSTPFRATRKRKVPLIGDDEEQDSIFEKVAKKQGKSRFETPVATATAGSRIAIPFASSKKTPVSSVIVEHVEESGDTDVYVHRLMKRRLLAKGKKKALETPKTKKQVNVEISPQQKLVFEKMLKDKKDLSEHHKDSDMEDDYYWDDEVEN